MADQSLDELKRKYPYINSNTVETFLAIGATECQFEKSNMNAKEEIDRLLTVYYGQDYEFHQEEILRNEDSRSSAEESKMERIINVTGTTGAGKSATANTILGMKKFVESSAAIPKTKSESGTCQDTRTLVVDTPGSWKTTEIMHSEQVPVFYVFVINIASPRFNKDELSLVRNIRYPGKGPAITSGRCVAVLTHADSALQRKKIDEYISEIKGDPLHTFLTKDLNGRFIAVNNSADTSYEREQNQRAILSSIVKLANQPDSSSNLSCGISKSLQQNHIPTKPKNNSPTPQAPKDAKRDTEAAEDPPKIDQFDAAQKQNAPEEKSTIESTEVTPDRPINEGCTHEDGAQRNPHHKLGNSADTTLVNPSIQATSPSSDQGSKDKQTVIEMTEKACMTDWWKEQRSQSVQVDSQLNCCNHCCGSPLHMKITEQIMENLLKQKENLGLENELLRLKLQKAGKI